MRERERGREKGREKGREGETEGGRGIGKEGGKEGGGGKGGSPSQWHVTRQARRRAGRRAPCAGARRPGGGSPGRETSCSFSLSRTSSLSLGERAPAHLGLTVRHSGVRRSSCRCRSHTCPPPRPPTPRALTKPRRAGEVFPGPGAAPLPQQEGRRPLMRGPERRMASMSPSSSSPSPAGGRAAGGPAGAPGTRSRRRGGQGKGTEKADSDIFLQSDKGAWDSKSTTRRAPAAVTM